MVEEDENEKKWGWIGKGGDAEGKCSRIRQARGAVVRARLGSTGPC